MTADNDIAKRATDHFDSLSDLLAELPLSEESFAIRIGLAEQRVSFYQHLFSLGQLSTYRGSFLVWI